MFTEKLVTAVQVKTAKMMMRILTMIMMTIVMMVTMVIMTMALKTMMKIKIKMTIMYYSEWEVSEP